MKELTRQATLGHNILGDNSKVNFEERAKENKDSQAQWRTSEIPETWEIKAAGFQVQSQP